MKVIINHLTRMLSGYICAAGVDVETKQHVRLCPSRGHLRPELLTANGGFLEMSAILDLGPAKHTGQRPEVEDHEFDLKSVKHLGTLAPNRFWNMLTQVARPSLRGVFGSDLLQRGPASCGVDVDKGTASLGCIAQVEQPALYLRPRPERPQIRMKFSDGTFTVDVSVTDIRLYGADYITPDAKKVEAVAGRLRGESAILSVGLTRPYTPSDEAPPLHWLQVNNIHFEPRSRCSRSQVELGNESDFGTRANEGQSNESHKE